MEEQELLGRIAEIKEKIEKNGKLTADDFDIIGKSKDFDFGDDNFNTADALVKSIVTAPDFIAQQKKAVKQGKISNTLNDTLNAFNKIRDIGQSVDQIAQSDATLASLVKPGAPKVTPKSRELARSIENARLQATDASASTNAAQQQLLDTYRSDIANSRTASTGQASTFGSLAQAAAGRRSRGAVNLAATRSDILARNRGRLDNLVGQQLNERNAQFGQRALLHNRALNQYNSEQAAAGALGATGRGNLRNSLSNLNTLIPGISNAVSNIGGVTPRARSTNINMHPLGDGVSGIEDELNNSLLTPYPDFYNPYGFGGTQGNV